MVRVLNTALLVLLVASTTMAILAVCLPQIELDVQLSPSLMPQVHCQISLFFYNRRTVCPQRPLNNYRTPRHEGLYDCVPAYDKFMAALAFAVIGTIAVGFSLFTQLGTYCGLTQKVPTILATIAFIAFTISWPLSWSEITSKHCGRYVKDAVNSQGVTAYDATRGSGLNCLVSAWAISFFTMIAAWLVQKKATVIKAVAYVTLPQH